MTLKFNRVLEVVEDMFMQNIIKLSAKVHELSRTQFFALSDNGKESENPVL